MTKEELIKFLEPFDNEVKIINQDGEEIEAKYMLDDDGTGYIVVVEEK